MTRRAPPGVHELAQRLFRTWASAAGLVVFGAWWLQARGWWGRLIEGDPSGISPAIVALTVAVTAWCGRRVWWLLRQAQPGSAWRCQHAVERARAPDLSARLVSERSHGPHETAWWFAAGAIKRGLPGTVVGFIVMATEIGKLPSFDIARVQTLLKQMTGGMAIALHTTLVGLVANLWLGLQLPLLDRMADRLAADIPARDAIREAARDAAAAPLPGGEPA